MTYFLSTPKQAEGRELLRDLERQETLRLGDIGMVLYEKPESKEKVAGDISAYVKAVQKYLSSYRELRFRRLTFEIAKSGAARCITETSNGRESDQVGSPEKIKQILTDVKFDPLPDWYPEEKLRLDVDIY